MGAATDAILTCPDQAAWQDWLDAHHSASSGVWLRCAKKGAPTATVSYAEAVEAALCYGWIDGQKKPDNEHFWLQRFTPRSAKSIWSKVNREKAGALIAAGRMTAAGLREIERAQRDGRWESAYDSATTATVPDDLQVALDANPKARAFFGTLNSRNRYAILFRIQTAKKAETRKSRIEKFVQMLENEETIHP